jgi:hypothetical protein
MGIPEADRAAQPLHHGQLHLPEDLLLGKGMPVDVAPHPGLPPEGNVVASGQQADGMHLRGSRGEEPRRADRPIFPVPCPQHVIKRAADPMQIQVVGRCARRLQAILSRTQFTAIHTSSTATGTRAHVQSSRKSGRLNCRWNRPMLSVRSQGERRGETASLRGFLQVGFKRSPARNLHL